MFVKSSAMKTTFANFNAREGAFVVSTKNGDVVTKEAFNRLEGVFLSKAELVQDEFDGQPITKVRFTMLNEPKDQRFVVDYNIGIYATAKVAYSLLQIDPAKPVTMVAYMKKAGTKGNEDLKADMAESGVKQEGIGEHGYPHIPAGTIPKSVTQMVGKKQVTDSSEREEWIEARVKELAAKLGNAPAGSTEPTDPVNEKDPEIPF